MNAEIWIGFASEMTRDWTLFTPVWSWLQPGKAQPSNRNNVSGFYIHVLRRLVCPTVQCSGWNWSRDRRRMEWMLYQFAWHQLTSICNWSLNDIIDWLNALSRLNCMLPWDMYSTFRTAPFVSVLADRKAGLEFTLLSALPVVFWTHWPQSIINRINNH